MMGRIILKEGKGGALPKSATRVRAVPNHREETSSANLERSGRAFESGGYMLGCWSWDSGLDRYRERSRDRKREGPHV